MHRTSRVLLRAARGPADLLGDQILEPRARHAVMGFVYLGIGIQSRVVHDTIDKVIDDSRNRINASEPFVKSLLGSAAVARLDWFLLHQHLQESDLSAMLRTRCAAERRIIPQSA